MLQETLAKELFRFKASRSALRWQNLLLSCLLLLLGNLHAYHFIINKPYSPFFYQNEFAPAVMFACGHGFANPADNNIPLKDFLDKKTTIFECKNIPTVKLKPLNYFQSLEHFMILSAGLVWKFIGISWDNLIPLYLILYSLGLLSIYFIFRLGMNAYLAFLCSVFIAFSPLQMNYIMHLRDYSVAPFLLGFLCMVGQLVVSPLSKKKLFLFSSLAGIFLGLGLGFRVDLLILLPFYLVTLIFFIKIDKNFIKNKSIAAILFLLSVLIMGFPILSSMHGHGGGDLAHIIILGLADSFTSRLGLTQPETYSLIPAYRDLIPYTAVNSFSQRMYGVENLIPTATKNYSYYSSLFLLNYLITFPADFLVRIFASVLQAPLIFVHGCLQRIVTAFHLKNILLILPFLATTLVAFFQLRLALFLLFSLLYLGAYPVLQFDLRHYFYLEFIGLWFIGLLTQQVIFSIKNNYNVFFLRVKRQWKITFIIVAACFATVYTAVVLMRHYQTHHLTQLYKRYLTAETTVIKPILKEERKLVIKLPTTTYDQHVSSLDTVYLKITTQKKCPLEQISLQFHYQEEPPLYWEAPKILTLSTNKPMSYLLPIYNYHNVREQVLDEAFLPSYWIDYIEYSQPEAACIKSFAYFKKMNNIPLLLTLKLYDGWENSKLYQYFQKA
jgi:hypothetical protein